MLDRLFYLKAAADTARKEPIATIRVFKNNGHINGKGLAAYLKATNSVELTDAGMREITLLSYLKEEDMANLEKLCSVSEAQSKALSMYYVMKVVKADPFFALLNAEESFSHKLLSQNQSTVELVTQDQEKKCSVIFARQSLQRSPLFVIIEPNGMK